MAAPASELTVAPLLPPSTPQRHPWWTAALRLLVIGFAVMVTALLVSHARSVDWPAVLSALHGLSVMTLAGGALMAAVSFLLYSTFDLLGRHHIGHRLPTLRVMAITVVCYVFNLNLGALVGGVAFRYRLYSRLGLNPGEITQIVGLSMLTNWLGYMLLAGLTFATQTVALPAEWLQGPRAAWFGSAMSGIGVGMAAVPVLYLVACAWSPRRSWTLFGHELTLPAIGLGLSQLVLSSLHWLATTGILYVLLQERIAFPVVLGTLMISAVAGVITHIPGGLGVVEAVFIALLGDQLPHSELLAALLAYRALFYLLPLLLAFVAYLQLEATARHVKAKLSAAPTSGTA